MNNHTCGVGIIGYGPGSASQTFHVPLISHEQYFKIIAVSALNPEEARPLLPDITVTKDPEEVFQHPDIDLVIVATPNAWHYEYAEKALLAGKHVVVEKPLAITTADADKLIELARSKGLILSQFHNRRWDAGFLTLKKLLDENQFGTPRFFEMHYDRFEPNLSGNWREEQKLGNGVLFDLGVHLLDQTIALFGRPKSVNATVLSQRSSDKADDYFDLRMDYDGLQVTLGASLLAAIPGPRYRLCGTEGTFVKAGAPQQDPQAGQLIAGMRPGDEGWGEDTPDKYGIFSTGNTAEPVATTPGSYQSFYHLLAEAIAHDTPPPVPVEDARDIIAIIEAARLSHETGRRIPAKEIGFLLP